MINVIKCAIYIRVSTSEQELNGLSLHAQRKALTEYAESMGCKIVDYYADEGISARKPMKIRKELQRLLIDVQQNKIDMILVTKLDRWFRNIKDYQITEEILKSHNCHWKTIFENYDSSTANGQMIINIMLSVNQSECDRTSERIKAVFDYKRSKGEVTSGMAAPFGYTVINSKIIKDEHTQHIVEDAYRHYFSTFSVKKVLKYLQEVYGNDAPTYNMVERFFINEKYCGRFKENSDYCDPYITQQQFHKIQKIKQSKTPIKRGNEYLFSSMIKCPVCGNNFTGLVKKKFLKNGGVSVYTRYRCGNKYNVHPGANPSEKTIEEYLINNLMDALNSAIGKLETKQNTEPKKINTLAITKEIDRLNYQFQKGRISEDYYEVQYKTLQEKLNDSKDNADIIILNEYKAKLEEFSGDWLMLYKQLDRSHKQAFWKRNIEEIYIDRETRRVSGFKLLP